jgi:hypothetical protein
MAAKAPAQRKLATGHASPGPAPATTPATAAADWTQVAMRPDVFSAPPIQAKAAPDRIDTRSGPAGSGAPLHEPVRRTMEASFGADFSDVRVHQSPDAGAMGALAYAQGSDVHFAPGQYQPDSQSGQTLLGHELTHVLQQRAGRVKGAQGKGDAINADPALEAEADQLGSRAARGERVKVPGAPASATGRTRSPVRQGYTLYNPGHNPGEYQTNGGADFQSQVTAGGGSFIDPLTTAPRLQTQLAPAVRISQNGRLAIEDAALTNRQPKFFYADAALIPGWNDTLLAQGSFYELVVVGGPTLTFNMPVGGARTLAKIEARNRVRGNQGLNMTTAQQCDVTVQEVLGSTQHEPVPVFQNPPMDLPVGNRNTHRVINHYYVAAELAYEAAGGGGAGGGGAWGVGGMPAGGVNFGNPNTAFAPVAQDYGNAMNGHLGGVPNVALDNRMQALGVNEYANPEVGQGLVTHSLGVTTPALGGTQRQDDYNGRVIANPGNHNMWGFHWAGVIAKDGADYITLENYARNAEDNHMPLSADDPRFYFQMYGAGAQSWHAQWSAIGHGGREFSNPLSMVVETEESDAVFEERARRNFGANIDAIRDDHNTVAAAGNDDQLKIALLKGLAYAKKTVDDNAWGNQTRVNAWITAVTAVASLNPSVIALRGHALTVLGEIWRTPMGGR